MSLRFTAAQLGANKRSNKDKDDADDEFGPPTKRRAAFRDEAGPLPGNNEWASRFNTLDAVCHIARRLSCSLVLPPHSRTLNHSILKELLTATALFSNRTVGELYRGFDDRDTVATEQNTVASNELRRMKSDVRKHVDQIYDFEEFLETEVLDGVFTASYNEVKSYVEKVAGSNPLKELMAQLLVLRSVTVANASFKDDTIRQELVKIIVKHGDMRGNIHISENQPEILYARSTWYGYDQQPYLPNARVQNNPQPNAAAASKYVDIAPTHVGRLEDARVSYAEMIKLLSGLAELINLYDLTIKAETARRLQTQIYQGVEALELLMLRVRIPAELADLYEDKSYATNQMQLVRQMKAALRFSVNSELITQDALEEEYIKKLVYLLDEVTSSLRDATKAREVLEKLRASAIEIRIDELSGAEAAQAARNGRTTIKNCFLNFERLPYLSSFFRDEIVRASEDAVAIHRHAWDLEQLDDKDERIVTVIDECFDNMPTKLDHLRYLATILYYNKDIAREGDLGLRDLGTNVSSVIQIIDKTTPVTVDAMVATKLAGLVEFQFGTPLNIFDIAILGGLNPRTFAVINNLDTHPFNEQFFDKAIEFFDSKMLNAGLDTGMSREADLGLLLFTIEITNRALHTSYMQFQVGEVMQFSQPFFGAGRSGGGGGEKAQAQSQAQAPANAHTATDYENGLRASYAAEKSRYNNSPKLTFEKYCLQCLERGTELYIRMTHVLLKQAMVDTKQVYDNFRANKRNGDFMRAFAKMIGLTIQKGELDNPRLANQNIANLMKRKKDNSMNMHEARIQLHDALGITRHMHISAPFFPGF
jgi:hypothetical protein